MKTPLPLPETVGPYRVIEYLGRGGMGEVLRGHDDRLDRPVALKCILPDVRNPEKALRRFRREARAVARLNHPSIVQVYDWEESRRQHWLVMEFVQGRSLSEMLAEEPLPLERTLKIARDIASGLAEAHDAGLIHRDLKPTNVLVSTRGQSKILDFGLAKTIHLEDSGTDGTTVPSTTLTGEGQIVGTVTSMSPEQAMGKKVDHRSDLFSLGILLYEMLSGVLPFKASSTVETLTRICSAQEEPLRKLDPEIPVGVARLVARLLEKDPAWRPRDARQVVAEIDQICSGSRQTDAVDAAAEQETRVSLEATLAEGVRTKSRTAVKTLLLSDLVDSTRLVERVGDEQAAEIFKRHDRLARRLLAEHDGIEVDKSDGFLFLFNRPMAAVRYALAYHAELAELAARKGVDLKTRVGIHVGEVILRENPPSDVARGAKPLEVEGLAKVMAARFMSLAGGGQTLISQGVYDMARRASVGTEPLHEGLSWVSHGRYRVRGMEEPVAVFEMGVEGVAPLVAPLDSEKVVRVVDGSRPVFRRRFWLTAAAVVIAVGLWGVTLWLESSAEDPAFEPPMAASHHPTAERTPHELYQSGMAYLKRYGIEDNIDKAIIDFQKALDLKKDFAPALAGLSRAYRLDYTKGSMDSQRLKQALAVAERAVQANEYLAIARVSLGWVYFDMGRYDDAIAQLNKALEFEPSNGLAWSGLGRVYEAQSNFKQAEKHYMRAMDVSFAQGEILGAFYLRTDRYEEAITIFKRYIEEIPDDFLALSNLGVSYYRLGRLSEAATYFQHALMIKPDSSIYSNMGTIHFSHGLYSESASAYLKAIKSGGSNDYILWGNLGDARRWIPGQKIESHEAYLRAIQLLSEKLYAKSQDPKLRTLMALYLAKRGECSQAIVEISKKGKVPLVKGSAWFRVAVIHEICDRRDDALTALNKALKARYSIEDVRGNPELKDLRQDFGYHELIAKHLSQDKG